MFLFSCLRRPTLEWLYLGCTVLALASLAAPQGRVIVLGFDGADARTTQAMMDAGELPAMSRLAKQGTFAPLTSTYPAESAAGWAALHTGVGPVENGVASFVRRSTEDGVITPIEGHVRIESMPLSEAKGQGFFARTVHRFERLPLVIGGGLLAGLVLWLLFGIVFAIGRKTAIVVALGLGSVVGAGLWRAKAYLDIDIADVYHNRVKADGFWDYAAKAGVPSVVLDAALSFDRPHTEGARVLGGLGLPDVTGAISGSWGIYTDDPLMGGHLPEGESAGGTGSGRMYLLTDVRGTLQGEVFGPVNASQRASVLSEWREVALALESAGDMGYKEKGELDERLRKVKREAAQFGVARDGTALAQPMNSARSRLPISVQRSTTSIDLTLGDQTQTLQQGEWSDWFPLSFEINTMVSAPAICRARLNSIQPLELYVSTFEIDPERPLPWQPVSQPEGFAAEAAQWIGSSYETLGWSCMTNQLKDRRMPPDVFLEDIEFTMDWRRRLTLAALERDDWRLLFSVYSTTDRVQHMMYRFFDSEHPGYDASLANMEVPFFGESTRLSDTIPAIYRQMDQRVGEVMDAMRPDDVLILCADHGFTSFRRQVFLNNLLLDAGFLHLKEGVKVAEGSSPLRYVDWSRTKAYSLGLGMVYLNLEGREPDGIVGLEEARSVIEQVQRALLEAEDTGPEETPWEEPRNPVLDASIMWDTYPGEWQTTDYPCADLMVGLGEYYRVAWSGVMGGIALERTVDAVVPGSAYKDNANPWSGDHASNSPQLVTGIFFSSQKLELPSDGLSVLHVAPTVLRALNVPIPAELAREALPLEPIQ